MGWETRRGRRYYYRACKVNGRVTKAYGGSGPVAEFLAWQDAQGRSERLAAAEALGTTGTFATPLLIVGQTQVLGFRPAGLVAALGLALLGGHDFRREVPAPA
jgi:hypothetical protein